MSIVCEGQQIHHRVLVDAIEYGLVPVGGLGSIEGGVAIVCQCNS